MTGNGLRALQESLARTKTLKRLVLKSNNLGDHGARFLAAALSENQSLQDLDVDRTQICDEGMKSLASALKVHPNLSIAHLSGNPIGDPGMFALADMITVNCSLKELWLLDCIASPEAVQEFTKVLQMNLTLKKFAFRMLSKNAFYEVKKCHKFRRAIQTIADGSSTLNLSDVTVAEVGINKLAEVIASADHLKLCGLKDIKLEKCNLPPEGMENIAQALKATQGGLQKVSLNGTKLSDKAAESLVEVFQKNDGLKDVDLGNCGMSETSTAAVAAFVRGSRQEKTWNQSPPQIPRDNTVGTKMITLQYFYN
eukprot:83746-Amphidinium_carterae.1